MSFLWFHIYVENYIHELRHDGIFAFRYCELFHCISSCTLIIAYIIFDFHIYFRRHADFRWILFISLYFHYYYYYYAIIDAAIYFQVDFIYYYYYISYYYWFIFFLWLRWFSFIALLRFHFLRLFSLFIYYVTLHFIDYFLIISFSFISFYYFIIIIFRFSFDIIISLFSLFSYYADYWLFLIIFISFRHCFSPRKHAFPPLFADYWLVILLIIFIFAADIYHYLDIIIIIIICHWFIRLFIAIDWLFRACCFAAAHFLSLIFIFFIISLRCHLFLRFYFSSFIFISLMCHFAFAFRYLLLLLPRHYYCYSPCRWLLMPLFHCWLFSLLFLIIAIDIWCFHYAYWLCHYWWWHYFISIFSLFALLTLLLLYWCLLYSMGHLRCRWLLFIFDFRLFRYLFSPFIRCALKIIIISFLSISLPHLRHFHLLLINIAFFHCFSPLILLLLPFTSFRYWYFHNYFHFFFFHFIYFLHYSIIYYFLLSFSAALFIFRHYFRCSIIIISILLLLSPLPAPLFCLIIIIIIFIFTLIYWYCIIIWFSDYYFHFFSCFLSFFHFFFSLFDYFFDCRRWLLLSSLRVYCFHITPLSFSFIISIRHWLFSLFFDFLWYLRHLFHYFSLIFSLIDYYFSLFSFLSFFHFLWCLFSSDFLTLIISLLTLIADAT